MTHQLLDRILRSWRTSSIGITGTAVAVYLFTTLGCRWPAQGEWLAVILPAVIGLVVKEKK